ncbi:hypothetical protein DFH09DRAFT_1319970 [Mycena vulgaris]|nr:hypothetical protein DFH09DRAFT_1319970 [Mycena vulgaris]
MKQAKSAALYPGVASPSLHAAGAGLSPSFPRLRPSMAKATSRYALPSTSTSIRTRALMIMTQPFLSFLQTSLSTHSGRWSTTGAIIRYYTIAEIQAMATRLLDGGRRVEHELPLRTKSLGWSRDFLECTSTLFLDGYASLCPLDLRGRDVFLSSADLDDLNSTTSAQGPRRRHANPPRLRGRGDGWGRRIAGSKSAVIYGKGDERARAVNLGSFPCCSRPSMMRVRRLLHERAGAGSLAFCAAGRRGADAASRRLDDGAVLDATGTIRGLHGAAQAEIESCEKEAQLDLNDDSIGIEWRRRFCSTEDFDHDDDHG